MTILAIEESLTKEQFRISEGSIAWLRASLWVEVCPLHPFASPTREMLQLLGARDATRGSWPYY